VTQDDRHEYVVELRVTGIAVVRVEAVSDEAARELAIERVTPINVTELDERRVLRGVRVGAALTRALRDDPIDGAQTPPKGSD